MAKKKSGGGGGGGGKSKPEKELTKAQRIEAKKAKQAQKGLKKDRKQLEEEDIELILQEFVRKDAERTQVTVEAAAQPSPRANFTLSALPSGELLLFGGEYFDGDVNVCYNDLYRWSLDANVHDWKLISSPNSPPPRCSHQSVVYRDHLYVFGGEFATADQFHHYRVRVFILLVYMVGLTGSHLLPHTLVYVCIHQDFWRLDLKTNAWEAIEEKGGPSPRSGHRMVVWRNFLVVFGGFYEAARETKWFNDLFLFSFADQKWRKVNVPVHKLAPAARSGCQLAVHPSKDTIFVYGGYAKVKNVGEKSEGKVYADLWALHMTPVLKHQDPTWEKLSRKGQAPSPRGGAAVTVHKQRFILFGGVFDEEKRRHAMQSTFFNDLFVYDMDRRRWFEFKLRGKKSESKRRRKKKVGDATEDDDGGDSGDSGADSGADSDDDFEKMLENQFGYVDEAGNLVYIENEADEDEEKAEAPVAVKELAFEDEDEESKEDDDESKAEAKTTLADASSSRDVVAVDAKPEKQEDEAEEAAPAPCPRINPALIIRGSTLYVYGGVVEDGDREITLDDCWSLDLKRLDAWELLLPGTMAEQVWKGEVSETEESSDGDDDSDSDDDDDSDNSDDDTDARRPRQAEATAAASQADTVERVVEMLKEKDVEPTTTTTAKKKKKKASKKNPNDRRAIRAEMEALQEQLNLDDANRTPQMGENLRDFFARTAGYWSHEIGQRADTHERQLSLKEIKREGFSMAEERYNELLPGGDRVCVTL